MIGGGIFKNAINALLSVFSDEQSVTRKICVAGKIQKEIPVSGTITKEFLVSGKIDQRIALTGNILKQVPISGKITKRLSFVATIKREC